MRSDGLSSGPRGKHVLYPWQFLLSWDGYKTPVGAKIGAIETGWAQNDLIIGKTGEMLGCYDRLVEFGGSKKQSHMII